MGGQPDLQPLQLREVARLAILHDRSLPVTGPLSRSHMLPPTSLCPRWFVILAALLWAGSVHATLEEGFEHPPDSAKPRTWWHWVSGNVSTEGIKADLAAMKQVGVAGAQLFTVEQSDVKGPVKFMSPEWRDYVHQALAEADRLDLEMSMEACEGWSESGGPWIEPAQSMQQIVYRELNTLGDRTVSLALPQPPTVRDYYEDVALFAFPTLPGDDLPAPVAVTSSVREFTGGKAIDGDPATNENLNLEKANSPLWIELAYAAPVTCRSLTIDSEERDERIAGQLEASDDGENFLKVGDIALQGLFVFPAATGRFFRLSFPKVPAKTVRVAEIALRGARIDHLRARVGMQITSAVGLTDPGIGADDRIDPKTVVDLFGKKEWAAPPGKWTIVRLGHTSTGATTHPSAKPGLEGDKLSRAVVQDHIEHMFGPVFADSLGSVGKSLRYLLLDSWEAGCENWTPLMREEFTKHRGYDLWPWLAVFAGRVVGSAEETQRFLWDYRRTLADLVAENHYGTIQEFAHQRGMGLYAEATGIGMPTVADQLQCKGRTDIPMGEFWVGRKPQDSIDDPREAASAAHIYGQNIAAAEAFTATREAGAWKNDPYSLKALGDLEFCQGINRFVFHRYAHQPWMDRHPGMSMGPWGINFERTNTWWTQGSAWVSYLARCQYLLQQGRFAADLLYFYGEGVPVCVRHGDLKPAVPRGFDYDVCNAEILLGQASVQNGRIRLRSGMQYRVLVLPDTDRVTLPLLRKVAALVRDGAVIYGPRPSRSPGLTGYPECDRGVEETARDVWGDCDGERVKQHSFGMGKVAWGMPLEEVLGVPPDFEAAEKDVLSIHRADEQADLYFVSNQSPEARTVTCTFRVAGRVPELWHPDTGRIEAAALCATAEGRTSLPIHFDPTGSVFVVFRAAAPDSPVVASIAQDGKTLFADQKSSAAADLPVINQGRVELPVWESGSYAVTTGVGAAETEVAALPPKIEVGGPWRLSFPPAQGAPAEAVFDHLMSWSDSPDNGVKYFSGTAKYEQEVTIPAEFMGEGRRVYLDLGEVKNLAEIRVNGTPCGVLWKPPFRVDITDGITAGVNHLEIAVTNLWPNRLIGDQSLPKDQQITWASVALYKADSPLLPSGLLGPVTIVPAQRLGFKLR